MAAAGEDLVGDLGRQGGAHLADGALEGLAEDGVLEAGLLGLLGPDERQRFAGGEGDGDALAGHEPPADLAAVGVLRERKAGVLEGAQGALHGAHREVELGGELGGAAAVGRARARGAPRGHAELAPHDPFGISRGEQTWLGKGSQWKRGSQRVPLPLRVTLQVLPLRALAS